MTFSKLTLTTLLGDFATIVSGAPTARATSFKIKEGSGYFQVQNDGDILHDLFLATASEFFIKTISYEGDNSVPQLAYDDNGTVYGAWVLNTDTGFIFLREASENAAKTDMPCIAGLQRSGTLPWTIEPARTILLRRP
ncbi:hypothetical protein LTS10_013189 [Elasticomyces elasticus]|nr:hypothetical protein LTS10_013189 [Elasticomyces elasticus]